MTILHWSTWKSSERKMNNRLKLFQWQSNGRIWSIVECHQRTTFAEYFCSVWLCFTLLLKWKSVCLHPLFRIGIKQKHIFFSRHDRVIFFFSSQFSKTFLPPVLMKQKLNCSPEHSGSSNNNDYDDDVEDEKWTREKGVLLYINRTIFRWTNDMNSRMGWSQKQANNKIKQKRRR